MSSFFSMSSHLPVLQESGRRSPEDIDEEERSAIALADPFDSLPDPPLSSFISWPPSSSSLAIAPGITFTTTTAAATNLSRVQPPKHSPPTAPEHDDPRGINNRAYRAYVYSTGGYHRRIQLGRSSPSSDFCFLSTSRRRVRWGGDGRGSGS
ncbi:hypothetical protein DL93DRAFT_2234481 [Clavulina sp. PMI_390]|nr:hypothetical protein DL93DRAFT_2234481 [Clavulina sp. PMI_390]